MNVDTAFDKRRESLGGGFWIETHTRKQEIIEMFLEYEGYLLMTISRYGFKQPYLQVSNWGRLDENEKDSALRHCQEICLAAGAEFEIALEQLL